MGQYNAPLRDMQFVLHELLGVEAELKSMPHHAELDADTINSIAEEAGKFASEITFPLNQSGDEEGCTLDKATGAVSGTPQAAGRSNFVLAARDEDGRVAPAAFARPHSIFLQQCEVSPAFRVAYPPWP